MIIIIWKLGIVLKGIVLVFSIAVISISSPFGIFDKAFADHGSGTFPPSIFRVIVELMIQTPIHV